jgi:hypothetical protein
MHPAAMSWFRHLLYLERQRVYDRSVVAMHLPVRYIVHPYYFERAITHWIYCIPFRLVLSPSCRLPLAFQTCRHQSHFAAKPFLRQLARYFHWGPFLLGLWNEYILMCRLVAVHKTPKVVVRNDKGSCIAQFSGTSRILVL